MPAHIRKPFRRVRRTTRNWAVANDVPPATLCGAPVTDRDVPMSRRGRVSKADLAAVTCTACRDQLGD